MRNLPEFLPLWLLVCAAQSSLVMGQPTLTTLEPSTRRPTVKPSPRLTTDPSPRPTLRPIRPSPPTIGPTTLAPTTLTPSTLTPSTATPSTVPPTTTQPTTAQPTTLTATPIALAPPNPTANSACQNVIIDFETQGNGKKLRSGDYVSNEWRDMYGIHISVSVNASGGFAPEGKARLFNTSNPGTINNGDPDLGSPNNQCYGPGQGVGGEPGQPGENCVPQGLGLIIQESDKITPDAAKCGGNVTFTFASPVDLNMIGLMNIVGDTSKIYVKTMGGSIVTIPILDIGVNAVQTAAIDMTQVTSVTVALTTSGAITLIDACLTTALDVPPPTTLPTVAPTLSPLFSAQVTDFLLMDSTTHLPIRTILGGDTLILAQLPSSWYIQAVTTPAMVGSVNFICDTLQPIGFDNAAPYDAVCDKWTIPGMHRIRVVPFELSDRKGRKGTPRGIRFTVV